MVATVGPTLRIVSWWTRPAERYVYGRQDDHQRAEDRRGRRGPQAETAGRDFFRHRCLPGRWLRLPHGTRRYARTVPGTLPLSRERLNLYGPNRSADAHASVRQRSARPVAGRSRPGRSGSAAVEGAAQVADPGIGVLPGDEVAAVVGRVRVRRARRSSTTSSDTRIGWAPRQRRPGWSSRHSLLPRDGGVVGAVEGRRAVLLVAVPNGGLRPKGQ